MVELFFSLGVHIQIEATNALSSLYKDPSGGVYIEKAFMDISLVCSFCVQMGSVMACRDLTCGAICF